MSSLCRKGQDSGFRSLEPGKRWLIAGLTLSLVLSPLLVSCAKREIAASQKTQERKLRVCADPNNLPFSNDRLEGFENKLAKLIAREMDAEVEYTWWAQRRGFIRNTLKAGDCDVVMGVPADFDMALTTKPYYRSSYAFVYRKDSGLKIRSFDDPLLRRVKVGVQMIGDDFTNSPPAHALANRRIVRNVVGFTVYGNYAEENPTAKIVRAVADGAIDAAVVWGPLAGYFAKRFSAELEVVPVAQQSEGALPFAFDISMGVRRGDKELKRELETILERKREEVERLLDDYGVPRVGGQTAVNQVRQVAQRRQQGQ